MRPLKLLYTVTMATGFSLGITSVVPSVAHAESTADDRAMAEALFRDGKALMNAGNPALACPKLAESQRLDPGGGTQLLLGFCLEAAGKLASAWVELNEALSVARRDGNEVREHLAREHIDALLPRLSGFQLVFDEAKPPRQLVVRQDGVEIPEPAWSTVLPLDPGLHLISFHASGFQAAEIKVEVTEEGTTVQVNVPVLEPVSEKVESITEKETLHEDVRGALEPPGESSSDPGITTRRTLGYVAGGIGVAAVVAGSVLGIQAISLNQQVENACPDHACHRTDLEDEYSKSRASATWSTVFFGAGLVGLATGAYLILTDSSKPAVARPSGNESSIDSVAFRGVDVAAIDHGGALLLKGAF